MTQQTQGILAMIGACTIWGLSPIYYKLLIHVPAPELLAHRGFWSLVVFAGVLAVQGRLRALHGPLSSLRALAVVAFAALMITANWFLLIVSVQIDRVTETSLGYYIFPLVAVLMGVALLGERLSRWQWVAVALAASGVMVLTIGLGAAPWISLVLALTFGLYGLVKKQLSVGPVVSVTAEVLLLAPFAFAYLAWLHVGGQAVFGQEAATTALLVFSGLLTAFPLILFSAAAQRVPLATLGLLQYLNPTLQFVCAVAVFGEPLTPWHQIAFALIWVALGLYSGTALWGETARRK